MFSFLTVRFRSDGPSGPIHAMAEPKEIADLVVFCLHPAQRSLNGATLDVNGGSYVR